jgi:hypothetical protein
MSDQVRTTSPCKSCGADPAVLELPDNHTDDSEVKCSVCGVGYGPYGDLKAHVPKLTRAQTHKKVRDVFGGPKGWRMK